MSNTTQLPADVRERVKRAWATVEAAALAQADVLDSHYGGQPAKAAEIRNAVEQVAALLRTPRGEGEAMDADEMWFHWSSGHESAALLGLRTATDEEAHRFLGMLADWQRCPMPSDHDAAAARLGEGGEALAVEVIRLNTALALLKTEENAAHVEAVATNAAWLEELERIAAFATRTPAAPALGWSEVRERANMLRAVLREHGFEHLRSALVGQRSDAVFYGQWERHKALLRDLLDALDAALRSETPGVTRCRICCERPAALTLCTECADEALWRSIYDQWLAEDAHPTDRSESDE